MAAAIAGVDNDLIRNVFNGLNPIAMALTALVPGAQFVTRGYAYDDIEWLPSNAAPKPSEEDIAARVRDIIAQQVAINAYVPQRRAAYPRVEQQLDMLYWDAVNGTTTWRDAIAAVKATHPKPG